MISTSNFSILLPFPSITIPQQLNTIQPLVKLAQTENLHIDIEQNGIGEFKIEKA